jgi:AcrR family transcriptional regulator
MSVKNIRGKETRAHILEAAAQEFASQGYSEATTTDILKRVGMTQPAFYRHFPNKQAIYEELVEGFHKGFNQLIKSVQLEPELKENDVKQKIFTAVKKVFHYLGSNPNLTKIGFIQDENADKLKDELATLIAENIRVEQKLGYIKKEASPITVGESLIGMIERLTIRFLFTEEKTPETLAYEIVELLGPALIKQ